MFDENSLKTQDIRSKLVAFDSIRLTLPVKKKCMYLSLKNNLLFPKKRRFSCLSPTEYDILDMIEDNSLKTQDIRFKLVAFHSIRFEGYATLKIIKHSDTVKLNSCINDKSN